ncbi:hypothetical protein NPIL_226511 [Nephila pilipes]|uniref:Uncharacterized protein n=1 Tax=Nephila pilipes TaxID=299642 RepID=A0A8X6JN32_NEPPI|nr:hypothetical protein NPIL_226511 [Nephila pilipes]
MKQARTTHLKESVLQRERSPGFGSGLASPTRMECSKENGPKSFSLTSYAGRPTFRTRMEQNRQESFRTVLECSKKFESELLEIREQLCYKKWSRKAFQ